MPRKCDSSQKEKHRTSPRSYPPPHQPAQSWLARCEKQRCMCLCVCVEGSLSFCLVCSVLPSWVLLSVLSHVTTSLL